MAHDHHMYMLLADTAAQLHDADALHQYTPRLEELAIRDGHQLYLAIAQRSWGVAHRLAGEHDEAVTRLTNALGLFRRLGTRWQTGRTLFELGELGLERGEKDNAQNYFFLALEAFEAMKSKPDIERTRAALEMYS